MGSHAVLSASGASKWLNCPPSARLEEYFPESSSIYAEEGTLAHALGELRLKEALKNITKKEINAEFKAIQASEFYNDEMVEKIAEYVDYGMEQVSEARARTKDTLIFLEQRLDFSTWVPDGFGTGDLVIVSDDILQIIDLKYGKGVAVSSINNKQMMLYALGAVEAFGLLYDINKVHMTICQPRLDNISTYEMTVEDLYKWADEYLAPIAKQAYAGEGDYNSGTHCRFCKARFTCKARAEANLELAKMDFQEPDVLSDDEIAEVLTKATELQAWASDIQNYALDQAINKGVHWTGYKLVEGRSTRKYTDEGSVEVALLNANYERAKILKEPELLGITAMEKLLTKKKFNEILSNLIIKPEGKPTLVPETDKRPELNSVGKAAEDFKEE